MITFMRRICLLLAGFAALAGCGKRGPLIYPDLLVPQPPQAVTVEQNGVALRLSFELPSKDMAGRRLIDLGSIIVQRRELQPDEKGNCGSCPMDYLPAIVVNPEFPDPARKAGSRVEWIDNRVTTGKRYQYRLVASGRDGAQGPAVESGQTIVSKPPDAPAVVARAIHGGAIVLTLTGQAPEKAELVGYRLYRTAAAEPMPAEPRAIIIKTARYEDQSVQRDVIYRYAARIIVRRGDGVIVASELSPAVTAKVTDDP